MRILIVEDEQPLREGLVDLLTAAGHDTVAVADGPSGLERATHDPFDLVLLDLMLPGLDGLEVCRQVRQVRPELPILMLTARGSEDDKVVGFAAGADDYLAKPFGVRELLARVDAFARRAKTAPMPPEIVDIAGCRFDFGRHLVVRDGQEEKLQDYKDNLEPNEQKAFELIKKEKILKDAELSPLMQVSMRAIKDFAIPLKVNKTEIFWKWYLLTNGDATNLIKEKLKPKPKGNSGF